MGTRFFSSRPWAWLLWGTVVLVGLMGLGSPAWAEAVEGKQASAESTKAGFVYNFIKYTAWPAGGEPQGDVRVCTLRANALQGQLSRLQGLKVGELSVTVVRPSGPEEWGRCQVLYVSSADADRVETVLRFLARKPVLTISDLPDFAQQGGMIELREVDQRIRFEVNLGAAQRAGLALSSPMLKLALRVWP